MHLREEELVQLDDYEPTITEEQEEDEELGLQDEGEYNVMGDKQTQAERIEA